MSIFNRLINTETGEIDQIALAEAAKVYATREYGSPNYPPSYQRAADQWVRERADAMRIAWRQARGLKCWDESEMAPGFAPDWGNSGDSFARGR